MGERESGTARLEEAGAAYDAAQPVFMRARADYIHCYHGDTGRFRAHYGWSNPFAVRSVQKDQIGAGGNKIIHLIGLIVNVISCWIRTGI